MPLPAYLPHILYATALTSVSVHLLTKRRFQSDLALQNAAKISVLESLVSRLRQGENVSDLEISRLKKMASFNSDTPPAPVAGGGVLGAAQTGAGNGHANDDDHISERHLIERDGDRSRSSVIREKNVDWKTVFLGRPNVKADDSDALLERTINDAIANESQTSPEIVGSVWSFVDV